MADIFKKYISLSEIEKAEAFDVLHFDLPKRDLDKIPNSSKATRVDDILKELVAPGCYARNWFSFFRALDSCINSDQVIKCTDFDIAAGNSDSECFQDDEKSYGDGLEKSKSLVAENPSICKHCVYNQKHEGHNYFSWEKYRESIGIPSK